jgi:hypothetical protein
VNSIESACVWLQSSAFATAIREIGWIFPTIETVHVFCIALVLGSIMLVDLRLLGFANKERAFTAVAQEMLPWTWSMFIVAAVAGSLMFCSKAATYYGNGPFRLKLLCLALAGLNMAVFQLFGMRDIAHWDCGTPTLRARLAGAASLILWLTIVGAGRWIGFTT